MKILKVKHIYEPWDDDSLGLQFDHGSFLSEAHDSSRTKTRNLHIQNKTVKIKPRTTGIPLIDLDQQYDAEPELRMFSLPPGINLQDTVSYAHQSESKGVVRLYIVDSGADMNHPVSKTYKDKSIKVLLTEICRLGQLCPCIQTLPNSYFQILL